MGERIGGNILSVLNMLTICRHARVGPHVGKRHAGQEARLPCRCKFAFAEFIAFHTAKSAVARNTAVTGAAARHTGRRACGSSGFLRSTMSRSVLSTENPCTYAHVA